MISINASTTALVAQNDLTNTQNALSDNMLQLSTGKRINSAADDAAGLQITNRMETQISGLDQAQRNATDATSMAQTAEGALQETTDILNRVNDLALQSVNDSNSMADRAAIQNEVDQLIKEVDDIASDTNFAGQDLLNGTSFTFQVGTDASDTISIDIGDMSADKLGANVTTYDYADNVTAAATAGALVTDAGNNLDGDQTVVLNTAEGEQEIGLSNGMSTQEVEEEIEGVLGGNVTVASATNAATIAFDANVAKYIDINGISTKNSAGGEQMAEVDVSKEVGTPSFETVKEIDLSSQDGATGALMVLEGALAQVDAERAELGAFQNRMDSKIDNMANIEENMSAAQSQMLDADFAQQTTEMTSNQMLMQSGASVLSQAKTMPQYATQLMG
ncbi:hypothetical protein ACH42_14985 [Endozoicomonas sp. (ex Bugula neritina AB1)]|nr:hypothetical protein ACH42_14985 [Endozoicomonas sp. (ex Bugula neritina AB1)]